MKCWTTTLTSKMVPTLTLALTLMSALTLTMATTSNPRLTLTPKTLTLILSVDRDVTLAHALNLTLTFALILTLTHKQPLHDCPVWSLCTLQHVPVIEPLVTTHVSTST